MPARAAAQQSPRSYARSLAASEYGWSDAKQWQALDAIISPESGWNPCASYPGRHDCSYAGANSCGIPQANPCPELWRGKLAETWRAQVRWTLDYIKGRYRDPVGALYFRRGHGWY